MARKFILILLLVVAATVLYVYYSKIYGPNVIADSNDKKYLYVPTNTAFNGLTEILAKKALVKSIDNFIFAAKFLHYGSVIKPGKYRLTNGMSNKTLIRKIQLGEQEPVKVILHDLRLKENLAGYVSRKIEADSLSILGLLNDAHFTDSIGFSPETVYTLFIPNTYIFFWNTTPKQFFHRMLEEYHRFWTEEMIEKAKAMDLDPVKVTILASIVNQETNKVSEMPTVASVYLNRLKKGMRLEADPTVVFANNDFTIKRVSGKYLSKDSPYNTYRYTGLPPGPITMPSIPAIRAVLDHAETKYIYFCAREDFSGYHNFAATPAEQHINAKKYHDALDARNIR